MSMPTLPKWIEKWNRKIHIYLGLYFLLFIWLFAFSGLMLNHPRWEWTRFWEHRKEQVFLHQLQPISEQDDFARAEEIADRLDLVGEIQSVRIFPKEHRFRFQVLRPGKTAQVIVNVDTWQVEVKDITTNVFGIMHYLHQFNGVRMDNPKEMRDWFATSLWTVAMDGLCLGLIILILSSLYMWYQLDKKRRLGLMILSFGVLSCAFFVFGLT